MDDAPDGTADATDRDTRPLFRGDCRACHRRVNGPLECCLLYHPAVQGFYWAHGVAVHAEPLWAALRRLAGDEWTVEATTDGFDCTVTLGDETLELAVDDALSVQDVRRPADHGPAHSHPTDTNHSHNNHTNPTNHSHNNHTNPTNHSHPVEDAPHSTSVE